MSHRIEDFEAFWPFYLGEHSLPKTRTLHFVGSTLGLLCLPVAFATGMYAVFLPLAFVCGYAFAWVSHFFVELNRPASFKYPLWSFRADWKMWALIARGAMPQELERLGIVAKAV